MGSTTKIGMGKLKKGHVVVRGGKPNATIVDADTRTSCTVVRLDSGETIRVWRHGYGSFLDVVISGATE